MSIGQNIANLRTQKGVTQEQLAGAVGVSAPAVSKWESGRSCPDIALLSPIARYFGVRIDDLLDFEPTLTAHEAKALGEECHALLGSGQWAEGLRRIDALRHEYPNNHALELELSHAISRSLIYAADDDQVSAALETRLHLLESAAQSTDASIRDMSQYLFAAALIAKGDTARAEPLLRAMSGDSDIHPEQLMTLIYLQNEDYPSAEQAAQQQLLHAITQAGQAMITLSSAVVKQDDAAKARLCADKALALFQLFGTMALSGATAAHLTEAYATIAKDDAALMRSVQLTADYLLAEGAPLQESPLFDRLTIKRNMDEKQRAALLTAYLKAYEHDERYEALRALPEWAPTIGRMRGGL